MTRKIILVNLIIITTILLAACGSPAAGPAPVANGPTVDPNLVFTSGAQTVVAQITLDAASRPIPTIAAPPTQKPLEALPTLPLAGGALPPLASAETPGAPAGAVVTQGIAVPTLVSMATLAPAAPAVTAGASIPDRLTWVSNVPADKSKLPAGKKFKITWKLSNSGTTTWTDTYTFRHYAVPSWLSTVRTRSSRMSYPVNRWTSPWIVWRPPRR